MTAAKPKPPPTDWRQFFDRSKLGAFDLRGRDVTLTIKECRKELLKTREIPKGKNKPVLYFRETDLALVLNKTNGTTIAALYGNDVSAWRDKKITLYPARVDFGRSKVDAIRIRDRAPGAATPTERLEPVAEEEREAAAAERAAIADGAETSPEDAEAAAAEAYFAKKDQGDTTT